MRSLVVRVVGDQETGRSLVMRVEGLNDLGGLPVSVDLGPGRQNYLGSGSGAHVETLRLV